MVTASTPDEALAGVAELAPLIEAHIEESEQQRHLADPVVDGLNDLALFRYYIPQSLGGLEGDPPTFYRLIEEIARIDGSAAWCAFIGSSVGVAGQFLPDPLPEEIWGADPRAILAGAVWPFNPAQVEDGGFRVSGQWPYASGCTHASYLLAGSMVVENGAPRRGPTGAPEIRILWVPKEQAEILDTWDVMGLAGTGSHDFKLENTFVPEDHSFVLGPGQPRGRHFQGTLYHHPFQSLFAQPVSAVALGVAAGAIDHAIEAARTKVPALSQSPLAERPLFQLQLAEAYATAAAGRAWLHQVQEEAWDTTLDGGRVDTAQRNLLNLAAANATECARRATETIYLASGASANYNRSPIPRALRDIHAISQHAATAPQQFPNAGRILAGLEPDNPLLLI